MTASVVYFLLLICAAHRLIDAAKLNHPRVLLPIFQEKSINFTLQVDERNCYKWTSSRQDLISVMPVYHDFSECAYEAVVTVRTRERRRNTAIVFAEEVHTGAVLRCDVIVDNIACLNVRTATRQLYLEEAPAIFELHAFDSQGNEFFTLEGIEFNWGISEPDSKKPPAMRFLTFSQSPFHTVPPALEKFEAVGIKGYMILLEGINTGTSKITITLPYADYSNVKPLEVYISVLANIIIEPSEATILNKDSISFRILQLKMDKLHDITESKQYFLEVEDTEVASLRGSTATGETLGRTQILLRDRNMPETVKNTKGPSALLTVAEPHKLGISLLPYNNWVTVEGEKHEVVFDLYAPDGQKVTLGNRFAIHSNLDKSLFGILNKTKNGSCLYGEALQKGVSTISGMYDQLAVEAELQIFEKLQLRPSKVILPYDTNSIKPLKLQFYAAGGDYSYVWQSGNEQVLKIDAQGLATTEMRLSTGTQEQYDDGNLLAAHTTVKVALAKNQNVAQLAQIYFLSPQRLEIKQYNFETALKDYVLLHVAVYAHANDSEVPYTNCDNLHFQLDFSQPILQLENNWEAEKLAPDACHVLRLRATAVGSTSLRVSYIFQDKVLQDTVDLHVFEALSVLNPLENELVLPIGSSRNVIYVHGPRRIFTLEAELTKATNFNGKVVKVSEIELDAEDPITAFSILCRELGETVFQYRVYNSLATSKFVAFKSEVTTKVHCVMPRFLKLYSRQVLRQSCPLEHRSKLLYLKSQENNFEIEIEVQDAKNRRLMNISSLWLDWEFAAGDERYHVDNIPHHQMSEVDLLHGVNVTSTEMLVLTLSEVSPNFRIKGTVVRYNDKMLAQHDIYAERPPFGVKNLKTGSITTPLIENEIRFHTVNSTLLPKDHISVYLAPNYRERIPIAQGSGFFEMELSESGIVNVVHDEKAGILLLTPLRLGHTRLELADRCLMNENSVLSISVVGIGSISVVSMDRVERTNSIEAIVKLFDTNDNVLDVDPNKLAVYDLSEVVFDPTILSVRLDEQGHLEPGQIRYSITGNNIGESKIVFQAGKGPQQVSSPAIVVQVFAPIRLYPRDSTLVVGSSIQIYYQGGPQPNTNVIYTVEKEQVATMSSAIVTAHRLGATQITGKCLLKNPVTGKDEVVSQDTIEVRVAALKAVQIRTPLVRIRSGAVMPATLWGQPDFSPMVLGTLEDLRITWTVSQPDVVEIFNVFTAAGIEYQSGDLISVRVRAMNPGKVTITASVRLADGTKLPATSVELIVFKTLELLGPKPIKMDSILAAPRSTLQLKSNMGDAVYKLDEQSSGIVSVTPDGIVHTKDTLGRDLIIAKTVDQNLPIGIEVKNVQYILVSLLPHMKFKKLEHKIPRGMNFLFKVSLHDNLGNELSHNIEDANGLRYDLATKDVVDVQIDNNLTIAVQLQRETNNMISISLKDTTGVKHAEDYIKLSVVESKNIYPTKTIFSVGDIICFDSPLTSSIWKSSNEQIVTINKHTGIARVLNHRHKLGEKIVITSGDEANRGGFIKYDLEVRESDAIVFDKSTDKFSGSEYRGQLVLRNHMQSEKRSNLIAHNVTKCAVQLDNVPVDVFTCRLVAKDVLGQQLLKLYKAQPMFDAFSGKYSCRLELLSSFVELLAVVKTNDVLLELRAAMPNGVLDTMSLKLVPGIKVMPESVQVTDLKPQELHISGLDKALHKLQVKSSTSKYFSVDFLEHGHGISKYSLRFFEDFPMDEHFYVLIESPETEQIIEIPIAGSTMLAQKCADRPYGGPLFYRLVENIGFLLTTTVIVIISIWVYVACFQSQGVTQVNSEVFQMQKSKNSPTASPNVFDDSSSIRRNYSHSSRRDHLDNSMDSYVYGSPRLSSANRSGNSPRFN
ncbi:nuclear pore membrane glycoprotein 210-like isoform X1 [Drosophila subobscura]|uniref:nuclear pore membrane glycoprotein 210-like isoform X1 n=1 Tax=Drosophila subobscura TaxID=7241 RepID=UPI00155A6663|nr:nuclear pore membrane glycoprotein 210-like isoform X1 [Drosophila subobscura]